MIKSLVQLSSGFWLAILRLLMGRPRQVPNRRRIAQLEHTLKVEVTPSFHKGCYDCQRVTWKKLQQADRALKTGDVGYAAVLMGMMSEDEANDLQHRFETLLDEPTKIMVLPKGASITPLHGGHTSSTGQVRALPILDKLPCAHTEVRWGEHGWICKRCEVWIDEPDHAVKRLERQMKSLVSIPPPDVGFKPEFGLGTHTTVPGLYVEPAKVEPKAPHTVTLHHQYPGNGTNAEIAAWLLKATPETAELEMMDDGIIRWATVWDTPTKKRIVEITPRLQVRKHNLVTIRWKPKL